MAANDSYVLNEAADISRRLIESDWTTPAMQTEENRTPVRKTRRDLVLWQLSRNCGALPKDTIDHIVTVQLRALR